MSRKWTSSIHDRVCGPEAITRWPDRLLCVNWQLVLWFLFGNGRGPASRSRSAGLNVWAAAFAVSKFITPEMPLGWASTIVAILIMGGVQLACVELLVKYLGRIFLI